MPEVRRRWTVAEVQALPEDGNRYELVRGQLLVSPAPMPRHQAVITFLFGALCNYLTAIGRLHTLFTAPADISWDDETLVQPDILVVPPEEVTNSWTTYRTLLLAVEVISPSSARRDRGLKRRLYQRQQVRTYWVVDSERRVVEVWHPEDERPAVVTGVLTWQVTAESPVMRLDLAELFAGVP